MQSNISRNVSRTIFLAVVLLTGQTIKAEELPKTNLAEQGSVAQQTKRVSLAEAVQFTPEQKKAWQTMQRQTASHEQQMKKKYREIQILAQSGNYDEDKVEALAKEIAGDVKKYVEESARSRHDFFTSLNEDQKKKMQAAAKQTQQKKQQRVKAQ